MAYARAVDQLLPEFREVFPEFKETPDAKVKRYLALARQIFCKCEDGTLYLAAHLLVMANSSGMGEAGSVQTLGANQMAQGKIQSAKIDSKAVTFDTSTKTTNAQDAVYTTTNYGLMYLQLRDACAAYVLAMGNAGNQYAGAY